MHNMRTVFSWFLLVPFVFLSVSLPGCAGRKANTVQIYQTGDEERSCVGIEAEMSGIQEEIVRLIPQADKTAKNWILGTTGYFLLVPLFFMDLSKAEQQEINAFRHRYNYLLEIAQSKGCSTNRTPLPDFSDKKVMKEYLSDQSKMFPE